ncbi:MAG TPA: S41 family peptidase [Flavobacterium sp.]|uniref:S41 family peptidase n=1 Tax=Flavobacterium sp. TaxID=239 RepID=UPI002F416012
MKTISLLLLLTTFSLFAQNDAKTCEILSKINTLIQSEHFLPKPIDDSLSVFVFDHFIDELDPSHNLFLKSEYDSLSQKYRLQIDDYFNAKDCSFMTEIIRAYKIALVRNKGYLDSIAKENLDFKTKDTVRFYRKPHPFYLQENQLEKVWRKKIRYETLDDIVSKNNNLDSIKSNFNLLALASKKKIVENELCRINKVLESKMAFGESIFNHFCIYFDPHTSYFSNDSKSNFVASLSKEHLSLGLNVSLNEKNEIIIYALNPNGPAFQTGKIKKGDQIISVSNNKETLIVSCSTIQSISTMILSDTNKTIILTLRRNSGQNFDVAIDKELIKDEANAVYSFIIEEKKDKFGYLKIPSFYAGFEGNSGKSCAEDAALEILKLQKENIKGLIIDLVDNGGGSIEEAIKLAGMFIDSGPISIIVDNKQLQTIINDPYKDMLFKEPMVILINSNTASASEFFASILQDYHRALLLGSPTMGKATMQTILPLDKNDNENFLKVTINKFYRITGKSNQALGIIPDVTVPAIYETLYPKERNTPTSFKNDSLTTQLHFKPFLKSILLEKIADKSKNRIASDSYFNEIKQINQQITDLINKPKTAIPLTIEAIFKEQMKVTRLSEKIIAIEAHTNNLSICNSYLNEFLLTLYPSERENNQFQLEALKTNHFLKESIDILEDFNSLK